MGVIEPKPEVFKKLVIYIFLGVGGKKIKYPLEGKMIYLYSLGSVHLLFPIF